MAAGPYELVYRTCGEALAVAVGWLLVLHNCSSAALVARAVGSYLDALLSLPDNDAGHYDNGSNISALVVNGSLVLDDQRGSGIWPGEVAALAVFFSVVASIAAAAADMSKDAFARCLHLDSVWRMLSAIPSSWSLGCVVAINVLVVGFLIFAGAVSLSHGLHFDNWAGYERFFTGGVHGVSIQ